MKLGRITLIGIGLAIAVAAVFMLTRGLGGDRRSAGVGDPPPAAERSAPGDAQPPRWRDFAWTDPEEPAISRPIPEEAAPPVPDPFSRAVAASRGERVALQLEGLASGTDPMALISGRVVRLGDTIEGLRVARIDREGVSLVGVAEVRLELSKADGP